MRSTYRPPHHTPTLQTMLRTQLVRSPEMRLIAAILEDAIAWAWLDGASLSGRKRREFLEARAWLSDDRRDWPFTFANLCDILGLDADAVRRRMPAFAEEPETPSDPWPSPTPSPDASFDGHFEARQPRRVARGRRFGQLTRQAQVAQDLLDHGAVLNGRNQTEATAAAGAGEHIDLESPGRKIRDAPVPFIVADHLVLGRATLTRCAHPLRPERGAARLAERPRSRARVERLVRPPVGWNCAASSSPGTGSTSRTFASTRRSFSRVPRCAR